MLKVSLGADCSHAAQLPTPPQLGSHTPAPLAISSARCTSRLAVTSPDSIKSFIKSSMASRLRGSDFTPLICSGDPQLSGTPAWEGDGPCGTRPHQVHQKDGAPMRKRWDNWELFCLEERRLPCDPIATFLYLKGTYWKSARSDKRRGTGSNWNTVGLDCTLRKNSLLWGWWGTGTGCSGKLCTPHS